MRITKLMLNTLVIGALVLACTPDNLSSETPGSADALNQALRAQGLEPQAGGTIEQEFFSVPGQTIQIENAAIQVFEYPDAESRSTDSALISEDGSSIGTTMVTWVDTPHFWAQDRIIVLYVGSSQTIVDALSQILGQPFATGSGTGVSEQPSAVGAARAELAAQLDTQASAIELVSVEAVEWPNTCLGLGGADEACAEVITPGFRIVLAHNGVEHEVHTDRDGTNLRIR